MLTFREFRGSEDERQEQKALDLVRRGVNLQRGGDFWDDFLRLCGDSEGMAALLGVPKERVTGLYGRIEDMKSKVGNPEKGPKKAKMIKTGDQT